MSDQRGQRVVPIVAADDLFRRCSNGKRGRQRRDDADHRREDCRRVQRVEADIPDSPTPQERRAEDRLDHRAQRHQRCDAAPQTEQRRRGNARRRCADKGRQPFVARLMDQLGDEQRVGGPDEGKSAIEARQVDRCRCEDEIRYRDYRRACRPVDRGRRHGDAQRQQMHSRHLNDPPPCIRKCHGRSAKEIKLKSAIESEIDDGL